MLDRSMTGDQRTLGLRRHEGCCPSETREEISEKIVCALMPELSKKQTDIC